MKSNAPGKRKRVLPAKLNDTEYAEVEAKAKSAGQTLAAWTRARVGLPPAKLGRPWPKKTA